MIDAGCYKVASTGCSVESVWLGFRNGMYRFKGKYSSTKNFMDLLDSVMDKYVASRSVEIFDDEIACMVKRQVPDAQAGREDVPLRRAGFSSGVASGSGGTAARRSNGPPMGRGERSGSPVPARAAGLRSDGFGKRAGRADQLP